MIKVNGKPIQFPRFNDGSLRLNYGWISAQTTITWLYDGNEEEAMLLYYLTRHLRDSLHLEHITLNVPYLPEARQDRTKNKNECFTLKYFCEFINSLGFARVKVFDPHSYVCEALLNNLEITSPRALIQDLLDKDKNLLVGACDEGGMKRYCRIFNVPFVFGCKLRNWETQKIESLEIMGATHMVAGRDILLCDDIISRGSTTYMMASQLKDMGANKIYAYVSHLEKTVFGAHLNGQSLLEIPNLIEKIYTTNSLWRDVEHSKVEVIKEF